MHGVATQRIYAPVDDTTLDQIDQDVQEKCISRVQWVGTAIDTFLQLAGSNGGADPTKMHQELIQLRTDNERLWRETQHLMKSEESARSEVDQLRSRISTILEQMHQTQSELELARSTVAILQHDLEHYNDTISQKDQQIVKATRSMIL